MIPYEPIGEHEIRDEEEERRALAAWFRRDLRRAEERFDAGEFAEETVEMIKDVLRVLRRPDAELRLGDVQWALRRWGWAGWWSVFAKREPDLARVIRSEIVGRVLDRERVA